MVSQQIISIIIKAEDMASEQAKKVQDKFKGIGDAAKNANEKASQSSQKVKDTLEKQGQQMEKIVDNYMKVGTEGKKSFDKLNKAEQDAVLKFHKLNEEAQICLISAREVGQSLGTIGKGWALNQFKQATYDTNTWAGSLDLAKTKMQLLGNNTNTLKGKIQTTGMAIQTYLGTKWDLIKTKISGVAQSISGKIGSSIDSVKGKLNGLSGRFDKLKNSAKSTGNGLGFLGNAASMTAGMIGYDLFNSVVETTRASLNARSSIQSFGSRLKMSCSEVNTFQSSLDTLQNTYKKIDMDIVGQQATDMAYRLGIGKESLTELTETTAIFTDAMARNGRSAEDSMLAMSDAMDGQFKRLQEIGISQEDLKNNGWSGDIADKTSLLHAMNKALKDQHYDELAKSVDNLDDAWAVLSVTLGNLLEKILLPLTPVIVGLVSGFADVVDGIMGFIGNLQSAWSNMPDWAQMGIAVTGVGIAFGLLGTYLLATVVPGLVASTIAGINWIATAFGANVSAITLGGAFGLLASSIWAALSPLLPFIAAAALIAVAIFEIGKAFGWWTDIGSMVDAIGAGLKRMWDAFVNHPDVQGVISWLTYAFQTLGSWLTQAGQAVMKFFGISTGSKWDIVKDIIGVIGGAWQLLSTPIRAAIGVLQMAWGFLSGLIGPAVSIGQAIYNGLKPIVCILLGCSPGIVPALKKVHSFFMSVFNAIAGFVGGVVGSITNHLSPIIDILTMIGNFIIGQFMESWNTFITIVKVVWDNVSMLISVFNSFMTGQIDLSTMLSMVWNIISTMFSTVLNIIVQRVISFGASLRQLALTVAMNFVNNIITKISSLPGRVYTYLRSVYHRIVTTTTLWVAMARKKASLLIKAVITYLKQLPAKAYSALISVVSKITSAGAKWVSSVKTQAQKVVTGAYNTLSKIAGKISSALSGVKNAITKPFQQAYDYVKPIYDKIKNMVSAIPGLGGGAAGGDFAGGDLAGGDIIGTTSTTSNVDHKISGEFTIVHDLRNLPNSVDEQLIVQLLNDAMNDDEFAKKLANNMTFQKYDLDIKNRINARNRRARGI